MKFFNTTTFSIFHPIEKLALLLVCCLSFLYSSAQDVVTAKKIIDHTYQVTPSDTLVRFIENYGKDSLVQLLDQKIKMAAQYINDKTVYLRNPLNRVQLELINKQFHLGIDSVSFNGFSRAGWAMNMYDHYFNDEVSPATVLEIANGNYNLDSLVAFYIKDKNIRYYIITYCNILHPQPHVVIDELMKPEEGMYDHVNNYLLLTQFIRNGCGTNSIYAQTAKNKLFKMLYDIVYFTDDMPIEMDYDNVVDLNRAVAYGLYGSNFSLYDGRPFIHILNTQREDGGWPLFIGEKYQSNPLPTLYGIWALEEIKLHCLKYPN